MGVVIRIHGRRPLTCHHEAGHAVARWWLGHLSDEAVVLTVAEVRAGVTIPGRRGRQQHAEGAVNGYDLVEPSMQGRELAFRTEASFVEMLAGPCAEARYRRQSLSLCLFEGGARDLAEMARLRRDGFGDGQEGEQASARAVGIALSLVRSPMGWAAVQAIAAALLDRGRIDGGDVDALCSVAYGTPYAYDRWAEAWPPTPAQVRAGFLPAQEQAAA